MLNGFGYPVNTNAKQMCLAGGGVLTATKITHQ
jgi:hypothetical protein